MSAFLSPIGNSGTPFMTLQGVVLAGGQLFTYIAGTTTPQATWTTPAQSVQNANPIVLNSAGLPPQEIWLQQGVQYKFVLQDANSNTLATYDNISGINDTSVSVSEWISSNLTPTFVDTTHFTVPGNQTSVLTVNRRVRASVSAGTVYGTITASAFSSVTTVAVYWDSGALDSGLSAISYGINSAANTSIPPNQTDTFKGMYTNSSNPTFTNNTPAQIGNWTTSFASGLSAAFNPTTGTFSAPTTGWYEFDAGIVMTPFTTFGSGSGVTLQFARNGSVVNTASSFTGTSITTSIGVAGHSLMFLNVGDTANINGLQNGGGSASMTTTAIQNYLSIRQIA